jgi:hypothetical protein
MTIQQMMISFPSASFDPLEISSLVAWWDASDDSTITYTTAPNVTRWYDKKLTTRYGEITVANFPQYNATARNSRPGLEFNGSENLLLSNITNFPTGATDGSVFTTAYLGSVASAYYKIIAWGNTVGGQHRDLGITNANEHTWDTWSADSWYGSWTDSTDELVYQEHELSQATDRAYYVINGGTRQSGATVGSGNSTATTRGRIGGSAGASQSEGWQGVIQEIFVFNAFLSTTDRQKLEGYSAHKWNLASLLPSDHPYKSVAP